MAWIPACVGMTFSWFLLFLPVAAFAADAPHRYTFDGLEVSGWLPSDYGQKEVPGGWPVVIFSHGFHGCATQSTFLTEAMAKGGYAVFAPNHQDAACRSLRKWFQRPQAPFRDHTDKWSDKTYSDRRDDIEKLVNALQADKGFRGLDWQHVAISGHSLGGYTALGLAGGWDSWRDKRFKAVLALSPYAEPYVLNKTIGNIKVPAMYQGGTHDFGITPGISKEMGAYDMTNKPKYFVEFKDAGHFAWSDLRDAQHELIVDYSLAFLDHYLKGVPLPANFTRTGGEISDFRSAD